MPPERAKSMTEAAAHRLGRKGALSNGLAEKQQKAGSGKLNARERTGRGFKH